MCSNRIIHAAKTTRLNRQRVWQSRGLRLSHGERVSRLPCCSGCRRLMTHAPLMPDWNQVSQAHASAFGSFPYMEKHSVVYMETPIYWMNIKQRDDNVKFQSSKLTAEETELATAVFASHGSWGIWQIVLWLCDLNDNIYRKPNSLVAEMHIVNNIVSLLKYQSL